MKKFIKKSLLFAFIFTAFIGGAFASSRLPNGKKPNEKLMENLRSSVRILGTYYNTDKELDLQRQARDLITKVLKNEKFHDHAVLAFDDIDRECTRNYNEAQLSGDQLKIRAMSNAKQKSIIVRRQFGL